MNVIENWFLIVGLLNFILFIFSLFFFMPKKIFKTKPSEYCRILSSHFKYIIIIIGVVIFHLVEVNILDSYVTNLVGIDFANNIQMIEGGVVYWFSQNWTLSLVYFFVLQGSRSVCEAQQMEWDGP